MLRCERESQNRTLSDLGSETCIGSRYLQAIEEDNLKILPGAFFYKSFVKQYAAALGMDYARLAKAVDRIMPHEEEPDPLLAMSSSYEIAKGEGRTTFFKRNPSAWVVGLLALVLIGCSGLYVLWQKRERAKDPMEMAQVIPLPAGGLGITAAAVKVEPGKVFLDLAAREKTWVSLASDGKTIFNGVLNRSQTKNLAGAGSATLTIENAAGLDVRWNGKAIGPLSACGPVCTVLFTPENFQILAPRKM
ncbi:MAG TPA: RodZ domain-containing protein [Bryobacteraceae bacterium]|nr:RodZ domain-containing protein [Bryobacteraceae bacterium]